MTDAGVGAAEAVVCAHGVRIVDAGHLLETPRYAPGTLMHARLSRSNRPHSLAGPLLWRHVLGSGEHRTVYALHQSGSSHVLEVQCQGRGTLRLDDEGIDVHWSSEGTPARHYVLGLGLAALLERRGIPVLHGAAVRLPGGKALVLLGESGRGKSTLTSELVRAGCTLLSEDLVALHRSARGHEQVHPGPPEIRLWQDSAIHALGGSLPDGLPRVHQHFEKRILEVGAHLPGRCAASPSTLEAIAVLRPRTAGGVARLERARQSRAMPELLRHTLVGSAVDHLADRAERFHRVADCAERVPLWHFTAPDGHVHLEAAAGTLIRALDA